MMSASKMSASKPVLKLRTAPSPKEPPPPLPPSPPKPITMCQQGDFEKLLKLIAEEKVDINHRMASGSVPLHYAAAHGNMEAVSVLVEKYKCPPDFKNKKKLTPLHCAAHYGHLNVVEYLIRSGCRPQQCTNNALTSAVKAILSKCESPLYIKHELCVERNHIEYIKHELYVERNHIDIIRHLVGCGWIMNPEMAELAITFFIFRKVWCYIEK